MIYLLHGMDCLYKKNFFIHGLIFKYVTLEDPNPVYLNLKNLKANYKKRILIYL